MIGRGYREFVIDLADCEHMDSTFMGTLAGISQTFRVLKEGSLRVVNVCPRNVLLLENLGLNHLFAIEPAGPAPVVPEAEKIQMLPLPCEEGPVREVVLAAHEALIAANPENAARFHDVMEYLKGKSSS